MAWACQLIDVGVGDTGRDLLTGVTVTVADRARLGVLGANGTGKSSLLRTIAGIQPPTAGTVVRGRDLDVGILPQETVLDDHSTVAAAVRAGVIDTLQLAARYDQIAGRLTDAVSEDLLAELSSVQARLDHVHAWDLDARIAQAMHALRCPPADTPIGELSGGERRRVALCAVLIRQPDLLLLDEPTNHLDADSITWLETHLAHYPGALVTVTHDRRFLNQVADSIAEVHRGRVRTYRGNYTDYLHAKAEHAAVTGAKDAADRRRWNDELAWITASTHTRPTGVRLSRYMQMAAAADDSRSDVSQVPIPPGPRLGSRVLDVHHLGKSIGGRLLFDDLSFSLPRNGIVGVVGPNGAGKTTLFRMIVGTQHPDTGTIRLGGSVRLSYVDQDRAGMAPDATAWQLVCAEHDLLRLGRIDVASRSYLAAFGFRGADQQKPARLFSGGERGRLNLALTLKQGGNLILLDEPTNDLDLSTLADLESALDRFAGCAMIATHDRWLLDRVCTHILAWEGTDTHPGRWFWFEGTFADYEQSKTARLGDAAHPAAVHRRLTRS